MSDAAQCRDALRALERGDPSPAVALGADYGGPGAHALRFALWFADPEHFAPPDIEVVAAADGDDPALARDACVLGARAALLEFDDALFDRWVVLFEHTPGGAEEDGALAGELLRAWTEVTRGRPVGPTALDDLAARARSEDQAAAVVEAHTIAALCHLLREDLDAATEAARTASRISRVESIPHAEYLANIALARVRRFRGTPHLAVHILSALRAFAPTPYHHFIDTELCLAGAMPDAGALRDAVDAARRGDREGFDAHAAAALEATGGFAPVRDDVEALLAAVDPLGDIATDRAFLRGDTETSARGVRAGLPDEPSLLAFVVAGGGIPGRRVLGAGAGLAQEGGARRIALPVGQRRQVRVESALSVLALQPEGRVAEDEFFAQLYGFAFNSSLHEKVFSVLVSRMRQALGDAGKVHRGGGEVRLELRGPIAVPDPRCAPSLDDRVLRSLAREGAASAKAAAERLGVSLRVVQRVLKELTESGACVAERHGRGIAYIVQDTTFSHPTGVDLPASV